MPEWFVLKGFRMVPVVELEPSKFSTQARTSPEGSGRDLSAEWDRYWSKSLGDSGLVGLKPLRAGSWHVPTTEFVDPDGFRLYIKGMVDSWGGVEELNNPEAGPVLDGGLALVGPESDLLVEPQCCSDLGNLDGWRDAAGHREPGWEMLWVGHPWLSVRYSEPWLMLSDLHESKKPSDRWAVDPESLRRAVLGAEDELGRFAGGVANALISLGFIGDAPAMAQKLAGLRR